MKDSKDIAFAIEVGRRLRVTAWELGYRSDQELAALVGATRPQVNAWVNAWALPPVKYMLKLVERGVTLDWIYKGDGAGVPTKLYIRLMAAMEMNTPPPDAGPEPEPGPESAACSPPPKRRYDSTSRRAKAENAA